VTKALKALEQKIAGVEKGASKGILGRAFASLLGKEKWA
jgi:hypothetical protein